MGMQESLRERFARFAARRGEKLESRRPRAAGRWLELAARSMPRFDFVHRDLCAHYQRQNQPLKAAEAARQAAARFGKSPEALMLMGDCCVAAYRPHDALIAYENVLVIEERADAAMAAGELYSREGDHVTAGARYARAYAAGAGTDALRLNALELASAGDQRAAAEARLLWEKETGRRWADPWQPQARRQSVTTNRAERARS